LDAKAHLTVVPEVVVRYAFFCDWLGYLMLVKLSVVLAEGMLWTVVKAECGWSWCNDKTGNRMKVVPNMCLGRRLSLICAPVVKKVKGMTGSMEGVTMANALCGLPALT
jgi:hypothetical protein